jgi:tRNA threonylcarbamoyl adenosine modification protein YjeE
MTENDLKQVATDVAQPKTTEETSKKKRRPFHLPTRKLCGMAVLTALAVTLACTVHIPYFAAPFLEYSPTDVPILIASFMYGPLWGFVIAVIVALIQGFTVSASSGLIGIAMNLLSMTVFVLSAGLIYKFKHNLKGALIGLLTAFVCGVVTMVLWNILFTPIFMGVERSVVLTMIPSVILPFNVLKYAGNAALTFVLYKATGKLFKLAFSKVPDKTVKEDITVEDLLEGIEIVSTSVKDTYALAQRIAGLLEGGEVLLLDGDLGAGKTTFTKGLAKALGIEDDVTSPTFTIMNVYESGRLKLNHLDMYRLEHEDDLYELGVEDAMDGDTVTVIEWNKLTSLGDKVISIDIKVDKKKRIFKIKYEDTRS